jgi:YVTN family beta-propeller protein
MNKNIFYRSSAIVMISLIVISVLGLFQLTYGDSVEATIPVDNHPFLLEYNEDNRDIYVTNILEGTVSVIDSSSNTVSKSIRVQEFPQSIEFNPSNDKIYVANLYSQTVSVIDSSNNVIKIIPVGTAPDALEYNPANNDIYVGSNPVSVIDSSSNNVIANITTSPNVLAVKFNPFNDNIYVSTSPVDTVSVINSTTNTLIKTIPLGYTPGPSLEYNPANNDIYVGTFSNVVLVIDSTTNTLKSTITVGDQVGAIVFNPFNDNIYITAGNTVQVIDSSTNTVIDTIDVGAPTSAYGLEFNPSNHDIYVASWPHTVSVIDSTTNKIIDKILVGNNPRSFEYNSANENIYVSNTDDDTVSVISTVRNNPPDCRGATPSESNLWPPNHKLTNIRITGLTDPDGDRIKIKITAIAQDEPTKIGPGDQSPDGFGKGTDIAKVRAERDGNADGRFYHIWLEASDGKKKGTCSGEVIVTVPHDLATAPIDSGGIYDSTT